MKHLWQKNETIHSTVFHTIQISRSSGFSSPFQVEKSWPPFDDISKHTKWLYTQLCISSKFAVCRKKGLSLKHITTSRDTNQLKCK